MFVFALLVSTVAYAERGTREERELRSEKVEKAEKLKDRLKNASSTRETLKNVDTSCVASAVAEREDSIVDAWSTLDTEVVKILENRKSSLVSAWALSDAKERKAALKEVWSTSKKDRKEAVAEYKKVKKDAWVEFKQAARACGGSVGSEAVGESETGEKLEI